MEAVNAGIKLIMTTHGESLDEIKKTTNFKDDCLMKKSLNDLLS